MPEEEPLTNKNNFINFVRNLAEKLNDLKNKIINKINTDVTTERDRAVAVETNLEDKKYDKANLVGSNEVDKIEFLYNTYNPYGPTPADRQPVIKPDPRFITVKIGDTLYKVPVANPDDKIYVKCHTSCHTNCHGSCHGSWSY